MEGISKNITYRYKILDMIGKGGMSEVYLVNELDTNNKWAIKKYNKTNANNSQLFKNSIYTEANILSRLNHQCLPKFKEILEDENSIYIVMEYIEGSSLDRVLMDSGVQSEEQVLKWVKQLAQVLSYLHSQTPPIIYRDLKPSNIILQPNGNIKLIDLGIAREYKEENSCDTVLLGTNGFAAPEQYGYSQTDCRSDIFSLGMTLYYLLTGSNPIEFGYVYVPVRECNPILSTEIERIVNKCTNIDPNNRYQTCDELLVDLDNCSYVNMNNNRQMGNISNMNYTNDINQQDYTPNMVVCPKCGRQFTNNENFCVECGVSTIPYSNNQYTQNMYMSQYNPSGNQTNYGVANPTITKKEFIKNHLPASYVKSINIIAICAYICAGINIILSIIVYPLAMIDSLLLAGLALGMQLGRNKICAILLLVLGCAETILGIVLSGAVTSILWLVLGICAVILFVRIDKEYKSFLLRMQDNSINRY